MCKLIKEIVMSDVNKQLLEAAKALADEAFQSMVGGKGHLIDEMYEAIAAAEQAQQSDNQSEEAAYIKWMCETFPTVYDPPLARLWIEQKHVSFLAWMERAKQPPAQQQAELVTKTDTSLITAADAALRHIAAMHGAEVPLEPFSAAVTAQALASALHPHKTPFGREADSKMVMAISTTQQQAEPVAWHTNDPCVNSEHIEAIAKACRIIPSHTTVEYVARIVGFGHVLLADKSVQEAFVRANSHLLRTDPTKPPAVAVPDGWHETATVALRFIEENAGHDQLCGVFDLDDEGRHKACTCGMENATKKLRAMLAAAQKGGA